MMILHPDYTTVINAYLWHECNKQKKMDVSVNAICHVMAFLAAYEGSWITCQLLKRQRAQWYGKLILTVYVLARIWIIRLLW